MNALAALAYADVRSFVHAITGIRRNPGRSIIWLVFIVGISLNLWARSMRSNHNYGLFSGVSALYRADYAVCAVLGAGGLLLIIGTQSTVLFQHRAEARYVALSHIPAPLAVAYLQARSSFSVVVRSLIGVTYFFVFLMPARSSGGEILLDVTALFVMFFLFQVALFPRRHAPASIASIYTGIGMAALLLSLVCAGRDLLVQFDRQAQFFPIVAHLRMLHPGRILLVPEFATWCIIGCALGCAITVAIFAIAARDIYPELYASSEKHIDAFARRKRGERRAAPSVKLRTHRAKQRDAHVPGGAWVLLWKSWMPYRANATYIGVTLSYAVLAIVGFGIGVTSRLAPQAVEVSLLISGSYTLLLALSIIGSQTLASELQRPLFYLATPTLFERLAVLAVAGIWRPSLWTLAVAVAAMFGGLNTTVGIAAAVVAPCLYLLIAAIGYALFSFFPHSADRSGPLRLVPFLLLQVLLAPIVAMALVCTMLLHAPGFAVASCAVFALAEAALLIGIASWRLDGRTDILRAA